MIFNRDNIIDSSVFFSLHTPNIADLYLGYIVKMIPPLSEDTDFFAFKLLSVFLNIFRVVLSIFFIGSFLLRPLLMRPVSLIWARIVESDKPVFTLILGGAAAFATAISEAAKHFSG